MIVVGKEFLSESDHRGKVHAVPVDARTRRAALLACVEAASEVDHNGVGVSCDELAYGAVESLRAHGVNEHGASQDFGAGQVEPRGIGGLFGYAVIEDRGGGTRVKRA